MCKLLGWGGGGFVVEFERQSLKTILKTRYAVKELHQVYDSVTRLLVY